MGLRRHSLLYSSIIMLVVLQPLNSYLLFLQNPISNFLLSLANRKTNTPFILLPLWGFLLFIILYILATALYPGGSDANESAQGFSWRHNYWCELMATEARNGQPNSARLVAITALFILAISLVYFWYQVPLLFHNRKIDSRVIRYCGIGSMLVLPFLLNGMHDSVINLAALLGCIAIATFLLNMYRHKIFRLFYFGLFCLLLCGINNYVYYTGHLLHLLPVIQKFTFLIFLLWFSLVTLKLYHRKDLSVIVPSA